MSSADLHPSETPRRRLDDDGQTDWSLIDLAKRKTVSDPRARAAQARLLKLYGPAIRRYLFAGVGDWDEVDNLFQELALRLAEGRFDRADRTRGRFRHYLKSVLHNLVADHHAARRKGPRPLPPGDLEAAGFVPPDEALLDQAFREALLGRSWEGLRSRERETGRPYWSVLRFVAQNPGARSVQDEIASRFGDRIREHDKAGGARKLLMRARNEFGAQLLDSLSQTLAEPTLSELASELRELGLYALAEGEIRRRRGMC